MKSKSKNRVTERLVAGRKSFFVWVLIAASCLQLNAQSYRITDLGVLGRPEMGLNNFGQVTGTTSNNLAFRWQNNVLTELGTLGTTSFGRGINDAGQIAGYSYNGSSLRAAFFAVNNPVDLGALPSATASYPYAINNSGQIIGTTETGPGGYPFFATLWQGGSVTNLGSLLGNFSRAYAINDSGTIVGMSDNHGFVYTPTAGMQALPDPPGCVYSVAAAINNAGVIVGSAEATNYISSSHAVVWDHGTNKDLGLLIPPANALLSSAASINAFGEIVGASSSLTGNHAFIYHATNGMQDLNDLVPLPPAGCSRPRLLSMIPVKSWARDFTREPPTPICSPRCRNWLWPSPEPILPFPWASWRTGGSTPFKPLPISARGPTPADSLRPPQKQTGPPRLILSSEKHFIG